MSCPEDSPVLWAVAPAVIAAAIALPAGAVLEPVVARAVARAQAGPAENTVTLMPAPPGATARNTRPAPRQATPAPGGTVRFTRPGKVVINTRPPHQRPGSGQQPGRPAPPPIQGLFAPVFSIAGQNPYTAGELALLALAGLAIALAGAAGPASWAAAARTTATLRAE